MRPRPILFAALLALTSVPAALAGPTLVADFENLGVAPGNHDNGAPSNPTIGVLYEKDFLSGGIAFHNTFERSLFKGLTYDTYTDFAISAEHDTTTPGFGNQFSVYDTTSGNTTNAFAVAFVDQPVYVPVPVGLNALSARVANTTYAALSFRDGDSFARPATDGDYFELTITGYTSYDTTTRTGTPLAGAPITVSLADYRNGQRDILDTWRTVDLSPLAGASYFDFKLFSNIQNSFGPATPYYFALDDLTFEVGVQAVPEPATFGSTLALGGLSLLALRRRRASVS